MISKEQIETLGHSFQRIFALPFSRLTLLELQNSLTSTFGEQRDEANAVYESLMTGKITDGLKGESTDFLVDFFEEYSPRFRIAREVAESGEFMSSFTCEFLQQGNRVFFVNRMRRLDGQEYYFLSAPETNIRLAHMFINRLRDLKRNAGSIQLDATLIQELENLKTDTESLLN